MVSLRIKDGFYQTFQNEVVEKELKETNYDRMNDLVAQSWLHLTSSMRFDGPEKFQHRCGFWLKQPFRNDTSILFEKAQKIPPIHPPSIAHGVRILGRLLASTFTFASLVDIFSYSPSDQFSHSLMC